MTLEQWKPTSEMLKAWNRRDMEALKLGIDEEERSDIPPTPEMLARWRKLEFDVLLRGTEVKPKRLQEEDDPNWKPSPVMEKAWAEREKDAGFELGTISERMNQKPTPKMVLEWEKRKQEAFYRR